jgi:diguanylate cyclase (GGDEF)-like protein
MGDMLRKNLRTVDIASRYGGEEFLMILPETDLTGAKTVAEKLRNIVCNAEPPEGLPKDFRFTISLGIAIYPYDAESRERLINAADEALYTAKGAGRNCWRAYQNSLNR